MFVEQIEEVPFVPMWADQITLKRDGDLLSISGECRIAFVGTTDQKRPLEGDLLRIYANSTKRPKNSVSPHLQFANAETESTLVEFIRRYGPVWGRVRLQKILPNNQHTVAKIWAEETLKEAAREQWLFSRMVKLYALSADGRNSSG